MSRADNLPAAKPPTAIFSNSPHKVQSGTGTPKPYSVFGTVFLYVNSDSGAIGLLRIADSLKAPEQGEGKSVRML